MSTNRQFVFPPEGVSSAGTGSVAMFEVMADVNDASVDPAAEGVLVMRRDADSLFAPFVMRNAGLSDPGHALQAIVADGRYFEYAPEKFVDMTQIGATEDRSGAENTAFFAEAVEYAVAHDNAPIFWPAGTYEHAGLVLIDVAVPIIGAGPHSTILRVADASNGSISFRGEAGILEGVILCNLQVDGNYSTQTVSAHGVRGENLKGVLLRDLIIRDANTYGIGFQVGDFYEMTFDNITIIGSRDDGIDIKNNNDENRGIFLNNIKVYGFDMDGEGGKAGVDIRAHAILTNIYVEGDISPLSAGIRFRHGSGPADYGGPRCSLNNFHVQCTNVAENASCVQVINDNINVSNGLCIGSMWGLKVDQSALYANVSNVQCIANGEGSPNYDGAGLAVWGSMGTYSGIHIRDAANDGISVRGTTAGNSLYGIMVDNSTNQNIHCSLQNEVVCATIANITLSGEQTIDGVLTSADRVLVKDQTLPAQNGIYVSAAGAWTRATDCDEVIELKGLAVMATGGTVNAGKLFRNTNTWDIVIGTSPITWVETVVNKFFGGSIGPNINATVPVVPEQTEFHDMGGYRTSNYGTATLLAANTFVTVNHGLIEIPSSVIVTPMTTTWGSATKFGSNTFNSSSFRISVDIAPGTNVLFGWEARVLAT